MLSAILWSSMMQVVYACKTILNGDFVRTLIKQQGYPYKVTCRLNYVNYNYITTNLGYNFDSQPSYIT